MPVEFNSCSGNEKKRKNFKLVYKGAQGPVQNVTDKELLSNSLGHCNVIRFNILIRTAEFIILLPNLKKKIYLKMRSSKNGN